MTEEFTGVLKRFFPDESAMVVGNLKVRMSLALYTNVSEHFLPGTRVKVEVEDRRVKSVTLVEERSRDE